MKGIGERESCIYGALSCMSDFSALDFFWMTLDWIGLVMGIKGIHFCFGFGFG